MDEIMRQRLVNALMGDQSDRGAWRLGGIRPPPGPYQQRGQEGSQSGIAQESELMALERKLQTLAGGSLAGMSALGGFMGGPLGFPVTAAGFAGGAKTIRNADEADIRDVWTDKYRQKLQGR